MGMMMKKWMVRPRMMKEMRRVTNLKRMMIFRVAL